MCRKSAHIPPVPTGVYIDGMNLFYGALKGTPHKWLDLRSLSRALVPEDEIAVIRYFTARVKSRQGQEDSAALQSMYLRALRFSGGVDIHEGRMVYRSRRKPIDDRAMDRGEGLWPGLRPAGVFRYMWTQSMRRRDSRGVSLATVVIEEEKKSDVSLAVRLVEDCARGVIDKAIVVTNDSDLVDALLVARSFGVVVGIVNPRRSLASRHLSGAASFEIVLRRGVLARCQLPRVVAGPDGRQVTCPRDWTNMNNSAMSEPEMTS